MKPPPITVIVPTCERPDALADCLARLAPGRQTLAPDAYEVIVTDDSATPATQARVRDAFPWARWQAGPRRGPAANRNAGATQAAGTWLAFVDDDCLPEPGWLAAYAAAGADATAQVLEGRTLATGRRDALDLEAPENPAGGFLWSCNFAIRRELFAAVGGFDEGFPGPVMEDVDLRLRLEKRGVTAVFVREALVLHPWRQRKGVRFLRMYVDGLVRYLEKHPEQAPAFALRRLARYFLGVTVRRIRESMTTGTTRGLVRTTALEFYSAMLVATRRWRRTRR